MGCLTRMGLGHWNATTIAGMLRNPAYTGTAMFRRTRVAAPSGERLRPISGRHHPSRRACGSRVRVPQAQWILIPVPVIIGSEVFDAAGTQLDENRHRKLDGRRRPGAQAWLAAAGACGMPVLWLRVLQRDGARYGGRAPAGRLRPEYAIAGELGRAACMSP
jgi:hypothetical protein